MGAQGKSNGGGGTEKKGISSWMIIKTRGAVSHETVSESNVPKIFAVWHSRPGCNLSFGQTVPSSARRCALPRAAAGPPAIRVPGPASTACGPGPRGLLSVYWQWGCHDPPAGRPNYGPSTSTRQDLHQQVQVLSEHKTLAEGCPARRYKTNQARDSQKTSRSIIVSPRTSHKLHHQGTTTKKGEDVALSRPSGPPPPEEHRV